MNISSLAGQIYNAISNNALDAAQDTGNAALNRTELDPMLKKGLMLLSDMSVGDIINGEVLKAEGNNILLSLGQGAAIEARLSQDINTVEGQKMSFMVKNTDPSRISLSPLYANMNSSPTVLNALSEANLPNTDKLNYMVRSMMEEGLPIDRQSLYDMNKVMMKNPQVDPLDLARMVKLNIPLTEDMITQYENYKNFEHKITDSLSDISDSFSESILTVLDKEGPEEALQLFNKLTDILLPGKEEADAAESTAGKKVIPDPGSSPEGTDKKVINEQAVSGDDKMTLPQKSIDTLVSLLEKNGFPKELTEGIKSGQTGTDEMLKKILDTLDDENGIFKDMSMPQKGKVIADIADNDAFKALFKESLNRQWLLKPEDVAKEGNVGRLYEKMNEQIKTLTDSLSNTGRADIPIFQAAANVSSNIDFMNEINHMFNYVQIPLKMENGEKAGELYVYTNKRSLAEKEGNVSALLHLDMEFLGPMDVHVTLSDYTNVKTQFFLKDDSSLDLIAQNIDMLNERLNKRGYNMSAEFVNKDEHKSLIDNIKESSNNVPIYSQTSFDMRA